MTYLQFHFVFTLPALFILALLNWRDGAKGRVIQEGWRGKRFAFWGIIIHVLVALLYTTPWDNYLVYREVWGYPAGRVLATIGYVPIEEYLFFILQTLITSLWMLFLLKRIPIQEKLIKRSAAVRVWGTAISFLIAAFGLICLSFEWGTYLGLILVWAGPVMALQWGFGGDFLLARWRIISLIILVPSVYLWVADRIAIGLDIWWISPNFTTGIKPFGLPIEEAIFFLLTNVFVAFGMSLAMHPKSLERCKTLLGFIKWQNWWKAALVLWAFSMVPTPLFPDIFPLLAYLSTSLLVLGTLGYAVSRYGQKAWLLFAVAVGFGVFIEWLGETTSIPFGTYSYTAPGPSVFGVPVIVPLGWWAFSLIALAISPQKNKVWLAPLALVAWDIGLDPLMVSKGFWVFEQGVYYGIPLSNFIGWYISGVALIYILLKLEPALKMENTFELRLAFVAQAFLLSVGLLFFGMPVASLLTFLAMGSFAAFSFAPRPRAKLQATD